MQTRTVSTQMFIMLDTCKLLSAQEHSPRNANGAQVPSSSIKYVTGIIQKMLHAKKCKL
jgi:hypothetical protein